MLQADGVPDEDIETIGTKLDDLNWNKASNCLLAKGDQGLVAYFRVMAVPKHSQPSRPADEGRHPRSICPPFGAEAPPLSVDDLLEADAQLMPLPQALIDRLTEDKLYVPTTIDLGTYSELKRGVPTIGIPTVLLTSLPDDDGAAATVKALIGEIERGKGLIEDHIEDVELDQLDRREPLHGIGTHEGAKKHLEARNPTVLWGGLFALGLLVAHARRNPGSFRRGLAARSYMLVLSGSLTGVWLMLSLAMMRAEGHLNPKFRTLGASFRHTFQIVARMSDDRLMTPEGEIWRWLGLLLFPIILGWLFSDVIKEAFRLSAVKLAHLIRSAQVRQAPSAVITTAKCLQRIIRGLFGGPPASPGSLVFLNWNCRAGADGQRVAERRPAAERPGRRRWPVGIGAAEWRRGRRRQVRGRRSGLEGRDGEGGRARRERGHDRLGLGARGSAGPAAETSIPNMPTRRRCWRCWPFARCARTATGRACCRLPPKSASRGISRRRKTPCREASWR